MDNTQIDVKQLGELQKTLKQYILLCRDNKNLLRSKDKKQLYIDYVECLKAVNIVVKKYAIKGGSQLSVFKNEVKALKPKLAELKAIEKALAAEKLTERDIDNAVDIAEAIETILAVYEKLSDTEQKSEEKLKGQLDKALDRADEVVEKALEADTDDEEMMGKQLKGIKAQAQKLLQKYGISPTEFF
ncbi:MAG: hypothetical protein GY810_14135 [Aureispira sp.]|nr:hypothetical protein [Aureispira sp.]